MVTIVETNTVPLEEVIIKKNRVSQCIRGYNGYLTDMIEQETCNNCQYHVNGECEYIIIILDVPNNYREGWSQYVCPNCNTTNQMGNRGNAERNQTCKQCGMEFVFSPYWGYKDPFQKKVSELTKKLDTDQELVVAPVSLIPVEEGNSIPMNRNRFSDIDLV